MMSAHVGALVQLCDLLAWCLFPLNNEYATVNREHIQALTYTSCTRSRASRASSADKYSASGLLMAVGEGG